MMRLFPIMLGPATMGHDEPGPPVNHRYKGVVEALHRLTGATPLQFDDGANVRPNAANKPDRQSH